MALLSRFNFLYFICIWARGESEIARSPLLIAAPQIMLVWFFITIISFIGAVNTTALLLWHSNAEEMSGSITARLAPGGEITCARERGRKIRSDKDRRKLIIWKHKENNWTNKRAELWVISRDRGTEWEGWKKMGCSGFYVPCGHERDSLTLFWGAGGHEKWRGKLLQGEQRWE